LTLAVVNSAKPPGSLTRQTNQNPTPPSHPIRQVVTPKATGNIGTVTVLADSAGAKPVAIKKHNIIAGASLINGENS
jgi:hypothetical protein